MVCCFSILLWFWRQNQRILLEASTDSGVILQSAFFPFAYKNTVPMVYKYQRLEAVGF